MTPNLVSRVLSGLPVGPIREDVVPGGPSTHYFGESPQSPESKNRVEGVIGRHPGICPLKAVDLKFTD